MEAINSRANRSRLGHGPRTARSAFCYLERDNAVKPTSDFPGEHLHSFDVECLATARTCYETLFLKGALVMAPISTVFQPSEAA